MPLLRTEVTSAAIIDSATTRWSFDLSKLVVLPLLNSFYLEVMRMHNSLTVTRPLIADVEIAGYTLKQGNRVMAPSWMAHMDPEVWTIDGYGAEDFWPERFATAFGAGPEGTEAEEAASQLRKAMRPENFFPYGGGGVICAGRHFSK